MPTFLLILISALINTAAQLLMKAGADKLKSVAYSNLSALPLQLISNPYLVIGIICYVSSLAVWLIVLSRVPVSFAYPIASLAYVTTAVGAVFLFNEYLSLTRIIGILVIIFGVFLITRTA